MNESNNTNNFDNNQNINNNFNDVNPSINNSYNNPVNNVNNNFSNNDIGNSQNNDYSNQVNNYNQQPINNNINNEQNSNLMGSYTVPNNISNYPPQENMINSNNNVNDEELLKEFIGKNYDKITTRKFSFSGLFFSIGYMFYRKMFLYGLLLSLIEMIIMIFVPTTISSIIILAIMVLCGLFVNKLYVGYANRKINKIKFENANRDINSLKTICSMKGGTSVGKVFLGIIAEIGIALVIGVVVAIVGFKSAANNFLTDLFKNFNFTSNGSTNNKDNNKLNNNSDSDKDKNDDNKGKSNGESVEAFDSDFDGIIIYNYVEDIFYVNVPSIFEDKSNDFNMIEYTYEGSKGVFNECSFKIYSPVGYDDAKNLIAGMAKYDKAKTIYTDLINNTTWYNYSFDDIFGKVERYGTNVGNKVYIIDLEVQDDADSSCKNYLNNMMDSVRKK